MLQLFFSGIIWHYTKAYKEIFTLLCNTVWFLFHLFSIKDLIRTLFAPWQRLGERYRGGFHIGEWFASVAINVLMRGVGFFARSIVILIGLCCVVFTVVVFGAVFVVWTLIPVILVFLFVSSIKLFLHRI